MRIEILYQERKVDFEFTAGVPVSITRNGLHLEANAEGQYKIFDVQKVRLVAAGRVKVENCYEYTD